jgi:hypothetical protein
MGSRAFFGVLLWTGFAGVGDMVLEYRGDRMPAQNWAATCAPPRHTLDEGLIRNEYNKCDGDMVLTITRASKGRVSEGKALTLFVGQRHSPHWARTVS